MNRNPLRLLAVAPFVLTAVFGVRALADAPTAAHAAVHASRAGAIHCPKVTKLKRPESLNQIYRQDFFTPAIVLYFVEKCDPYHGGWTLNIANLLNGYYGQKIDQAKLPKGTRLWLPVIHPAS